MGFDCDLKEIFSFTYKATFDNDLTEHEYDHVFVGRYDGDPIPNPEQVDDWTCMDFEKLRKDIQDNPDRYTYWLKISIDKIHSHLP